MYQREKLIHLREKLNFRRRKIESFDNDLQIMIGNKNGLNFAIEINLCKMIFKPHDFL